MNRVYAENVIEKIVSAERSAAEIMMHAHDIIAESKSGQRDIVTEYDKRVQEYLAGAERIRAGGALFLRGAEEA